MSESTLLTLQMILEVAAATVAMFLEMVSSACQSAGVTEHTLAIQVILSWALLVGVFYGIAFALEIFNQILVILGRGCNAFLRRRSPWMGRVLDGFGALIVRSKPNKATT